MNSPGGNLFAGIQIGEMITDAKLSTIAYERCASVCGLIWLAGKHRGVYTDTFLGFHSTSDAIGQASYGGNAVVGAYLAKLGLNYDQIYYLTKTAPENMEWLTAEKAKKYGIKTNFLGGGSRLGNLPIR